MYQESIFETCQRMAMKVTPLSLWHHEQECHVWHKYILHHKTKKNLLFVHNEQANTLLTVELKFKAKNKTKMSVAKAVVLSYMYITSILHSQSNENTCTFSIFLGQIPSSLAVPIIFLQASCAPSLRPVFCFPFLTFLSQCIITHTLMAQADNKLKYKCIITHTLWHRLTKD